MLFRRFIPCLLVVSIGLLAVAGCEPYMSMTDPISAQTRQASALLPESPKFVGMVNLQEAVDKIGKLDRSLQVDSLENTDSEPLRTFLETTGVNPREDVRAAFGAMDEEEFTAVLFMNLTAEQVDRYLGTAPDEAGRATTYRDVPVYHLHFGPEWESDSHTMSIAIVDNGTIAAASGEDRIEAVVDRYQNERQRLQDNDDYMTLVERVGRGSTAWFVGSNVIEDALGDSTGFRASEDTVDGEDGSASVAQAGVQQALVEWSNRVLGLSEMSSGVSALEGEAMGRVRKLKEKVRRQALSLTLTDTAVEGNVYLSMIDDAEASSVVEMARGGLAFLRFSRSKFSGKKKELADDFLQEAEVEQDDSLVHLRFTIGRERLQGISSAGPRGTVDVGEPAAFSLADRLMEAPKNG